MNVPNLIVSISQRKMFFGHSSMAILQNNRKQYFKKTHFVTFLPFQNSSGEPWFPEIRRHRRLHGGLSVTGLHATVHRRRVGCDVAGRFKQSVGRKRSLDVINRDK